MANVRENPVTADSITRTPPPDASSAVTKTAFSSCMVKNIRGCRKTMCGRADGVCGHPDRANMMPRTQWM
jgi:hypothetical protein